MTGAKICRRFLTSWSCEEARQVCRDTRADSNENELLVPEGSLSQALPRHRDRLAPVAAESDAKGEIPCTISAEGARGTMAFPPQDGESEGQGDRNAARWAEGLAQPA